MWFIKFLKFLLWLLRLFVKKFRKRRSELERKQWKHVRNFAPTHYSWQKSIGKDKRKKKSKQKSNANFRQREVKKVDRRVSNKKTSVNIG